MSPHDGASSPYGRFRKPVLTAAAAILALGLGLGLGKGIAWMKGPPLGTATVARYRLPRGEGFELPSESNNRKVTIVAYVDFQCAACAAAWKEMWQTYKKSRHRDDLRFLFKDHPMPGHTDAMLSAEAVRAAREQDEGSALQMMSYLFEHPKDQARAELDGYAQVLGLDRARFRAALDSGRFKGAIARDVSEAERLGFLGTPTFFINGRRIEGTWGIATFEKLIEEEIDNANKLGVTSGYYEAFTRNGLDHAPPEPGKADPDALYRVPVGTAPARGPADAKVTIIEYADFECPYCGGFEETLAKVEAAWPTDVRVVFKQHPLPLHLHAARAAEAALAAGEQGKFWEMHDEMLHHQKALERDDLDACAARLGLAPGRFKEALDAGRFKAVVDADSAEAERFGAKGTPSFFVNGHFVSGAVSFETLQKTIDDEIAKANRLLAQGAPARGLYDALTREGKPGVEAPGAASFDVMTGAK